MKNRMMFVITAGLLEINVIQTADARTVQSAGSPAKLIKALKLSDE